MSNTSFSERISDTCTFEMIYVEGGKFMMGSLDSEGNKDGQPIHEVKLDGFYMGQYPVTQRLWESIMGSNPSYLKGSDRPVEDVSWDDCQEFFKKLNAETGKAYRLSTEAEWEYAARGGEKSKGFIYSGSNRLEEVGWFPTNSNEETKTVGQKIPNELGLFDMSGNVWEWCQDWYSSGNYWYHDWYNGDYYKECADTGLTVNPQGPGTGIFRVYRGGSFYSQRGHRVADRKHWFPDDRHFSLGFRLAVSLQFTP